MSQHNNPDNRFGIEEAGVIEEFHKFLTSSGSGRGVSLHFDSGIADQFSLDDETEVDVSVLSESGKLRFLVETDKGFSPEELRNYAERQTWGLLSEFEGDGEIAYTFGTEYATIEFDYTIGGIADNPPLQNVRVLGEPIELTESNAISVYRMLSTRSRESEFPIKPVIRDSRGLWTRLRASDDYQIGDDEVEEILEQLVSASDEVTIQPEITLSSLTNEIEEIEMAVSLIEDLVVEAQDTDFASQSAA